MVARVVSRSAYDHEHKCPCSVLLGCCDDGAWLLIVGAGLNAVAISTYSRILVAHGVLAQLRQLYRVRDVVPKQKSLAVHGAIAPWFGNQFIR